MSVSVVAETLFLACINILYPLFYMYHVTGKNKVVLLIVLYNGKPGMTLLLSRFWSDPFHNGR